MRVRGEEGRGRRSSNHKSRLRPGQWDWPAVDKPTIQGNR